MIEQSIGNLPQAEKGYRRPVSIYLVHLSSKASRFGSVLSEQTRSMLHAPRDKALSLTTAVPPVVPSGEDASGAPHEPQKEFCGLFLAPQFVQCSPGCTESAKSYSPPHRE